MSVQTASRRCSVSVAGRGRPEARLRAAKILETLVVLPDQKSHIIAVRLGFVRRMPWAAVAPPP